MKKAINIALILYLVAAFVAVYFFFLKWETKTVYGDDLFLFKSYFASESFAEKFEITFSSDKFRPVFGVIFSNVVGWFQNDSHSYFLLNTCIHAINTLLFMLVVNIVLESYLLAFLFSLAFSLSRFFYFFMGQLLVGGMLEGVALSFFLLVLYHTTIVLWRKDLKPEKVSQHLLLGLVFANLCIYSHERYIGTFAFILMVAFYCFWTGNLKKKEAVLVSALAVASVAFNVYVKVGLFHIPFLVGTGKTMIAFSLARSLGFLADGMLSILQINSGPEYLVGIQYAALPLREKMLVITTCLVSVVLPIIAPITGLKKAVITEQNGDPLVLERGGYRPRKLTVLFFLFVLLCLLMIPAVSTIRLEQRWLTGPLSVFMLLLAFSIETVFHQRTKLKYLIIIALACGMLWTNYSYLDIGLKNTYMFDSERTAKLFKDAQDNNIIRKSTKKLYLWAGNRDQNMENGNTWVLDSGYLFRFYGGTEKQIFYADSIFTKTDSTCYFSFPGFDTTTDQIILWAPVLKDLTSEFMKDSLKGFNASK